MTFRKALFWTHLTLGVGVGFLIFVVAFTGVMLAFRGQLTAWAERDVRTVQLPIQGVKKISLNQVISQAPRHQLRGITVYSDPSAAIVLQLAKNKVVYVHPYTGHVLGASSWVSGFFKQVEGVHRWFGLEGAFKPVAQIIKWVVNVVFLGMILSGIVLWWPRKLVLINARFTGKFRVWNWHQVVGFWSLPVLVVTVITGFLLMATEGKSTSKKWPQAQLSGPVDWDHLEEVAHAHVPNWKTVMFRLPKEKGPVMVVIEPLGGVVPTRTQLTLAHDGTVLDLNPGSSRAVHVWSKVVHTGEVGGWAGQLLVAIGSLGALGLILTGYVMSWRRFRNFCTEGRT